MNSFLEGFAAAFRALIGEEKGVKPAKHLEEGEITPSKRLYYTYLILEALIEMGGLGRAKDVINRVLEKMKDKLKPKDLETLPSRKEVRYVNHIRWERWRLANEGYIRKNAPPGIWEIPEKGRKYYEELKTKALGNFQTKQMRILDSIFHE